MNIVHQENAIKCRLQNGGDFVQASWVETMQWRDQSRPAQTTPLLEQQQSRVEYWSIDDD